MAREKKRGSLVQINRKGKKGPHRLGEPAQTTGEKKDESRIESSQMAGLT